MSNMELSVLHVWLRLCLMDTESSRFIEVWRAEPEEVDTAFSLVEEYFSTIGVVLRENRREFVDQYFGKGKGFWLAQVDSELAGCIGLRKLPLRAEKGCERTDCAEIKRMYVRENFRGRGIAQRLVETAEQCAREAGYAWIYLDTTNEMKAAAKLYERNGFLRCDRYNQNPQAAIFMRKDLS